ncbi:MAG: hypothetical protein LBP76_06075 [Treponema sp.]|jgi:hypothetical protein|nr:hypothetical protein [Treponema sp.]
MRGIDKELQELQDFIEQLIGERENVLRQEMNSAVEEERRRQQQQNISESAIAERMQIFYQEQIAALNAELVEYRKQIEAERYSIRARLQTLQEEYRKNFAELQAERARILEASRIREADIYAEAAARLGALESRYNTSRQSLTEVQEELRRLAEDREKAELAENQIAGFFGLVNKQIKERQFANASKSLDSLKQFLETPSLQHIRSFLHRKEINRAAVNALRQAYRRGVGQSGRSRF